MLNFLYRLRVKGYNDDGGVRRNEMHRDIFLKNKKRKELNIYTYIYTYRHTYGGDTALC